MSSLQHHEPKSILEHLGELRNKLFIALFAVLIGSTVAHIFHEKIIAFLLRSVGDQQHLVFLSPLEPFFFVFKIDFIVGIAIAFPVLVWCLFSYIVPALPKRAASFLIFFYIFSTVLLVAGLAYALLVTIPLSLKFLLSISVPGIQNTITAQSYLDFFIGQALIIMAIFQVPILIIGGIQLGAFKTKVLSSKRRYIYLILTVGLAILTPTTDIFSLLIVLLPCILIFEISLIGGRIVEFSKRRRQAAKAL